MMSNATVTDSDEYPGTGMGMGLFGVQMEGFLPGTYYDTNEGINSGNNLVATNMGIVEQIESKAVTWIKFKSLLIVLIVSFMLCYRLVLFLTKPPTRTRTPPRIWQWARSRLRIFGRDVGRPIDRLLYSWRRHQP